MYCREEVGNQLHLSVIHVKQIGSMAGARLAIYGNIGKTQQNIGTHRSNIGRIIKIIMASVGPCINNFIQTISLIAFFIFSASDWYNQIPNSLFLTSKSQNSMIY